MLWHLNKSWLAVILLAMAPGVCAQVSEKDKKLDAFWDTHGSAVGSAQLTLLNNPFVLVPVRFQCWQWKVWNEPEFILDEVPELDPRLLELIQDGTPIPEVAKIERPDQKAFFDLFNQAVWNAYITPPEAFRKSAEENEHVQFAHLWNDPDRYRGKIVSIKGKLGLLRLWDSVPRELKDKGINQLYEGWIFGPTQKAFPYHVIFPVPADDPMAKGGVLKPSEKMDRWVTFDGYFIKKARYRASDGRDRETPYLIGRTVQLVPAPPEPAKTVPSFPISPEILIIAASFMVGVIVLLMVCGLWFRKGDQQFQDRVAKMHLEQALAYLESSSQPDSAPKEPPPLARPVKPK